MYDKSIDYGSGISGDIGVGEREEGRKFIVVVVYGFIVIKV